MRTLILIFAAIVASQSAIAQAYQPFPTNNAQWRVRHHADSCIDMQYYVNGSDTMIKGLKYTKVFVRTAKTPRGSAPQFLFPAIKNIYATKPDEYVYAFREDNKKLYTIRKKDTAEYLYYDANLTVGDTVTSNDDILYKRVITAIDSVRIGSIFHKRFLVTTTNNSVSGLTNLYFTEGVGIDNNSPFDILNGQNYVRLHCFTNSSGTYNIDTFPCTYIFPYGTPTSISTSNENKKANIYPNPFTDYIDIDANAADIRLYDMTGRTVLATQIDNRRINTAQLPKGIYMLTLLKKDGSLIEHKKMVKE
jgi:hypothetical protein